MTSKSVQKRLRAQGQIGETSDLYYTNDAGEDYNMSQAVRDMIEKIDACVGRYDDECFL